MSNKYTNMSLRDQQHYYGMYNWKVQTTKSKRIFFVIHIPQHRFEQILRKSIQIHNRHHPVLLKLNGATSSRFQGACSMSDSQFS